MDGFSQFRDTVGWRNYIECSDVTESMVRKRSPYNTIICVELNGEDLSCYSIKTESARRRKCPCDY